MPRNFDARRLQLTRANLKDPRVAMRLIIGVLLAANLAAAIIAFKPFGGSAEEMMQEQASLGAKLAAIERDVASATHLVNNVEKARREGDDFLTTYFAPANTHTSVLTEELIRTSKEAGIRPLPATRQLEPVEGSDTIRQETVKASYEGSYSNLKKLIGLLDKSPRFLIIEDMTVGAPQQQAGQEVRVNLTLDTFVRDAQGGAQ